MYKITKNGEQVSPTKEVLAEIAKQVEEDAIKKIIGDDGYPTKDQPLWSVGAYRLCSLGTGGLSIAGKIDYDLGLVCDTKEQAQKRRDHNLALAKVLHYIRVNDLAVSDDYLIKYHRREYIFYDIQDCSFTVHKYGVTVIPSKIPALKGDCADIIIEKFEPELRIIFGV